MAPTVVCVTSLWLLGVLQAAPTALGPFRLAGWAALAQPALKLVVTARPGTQLRLEQLLRVSSSLTSTARRGQRIPSARAAVPVTESPPSELESERAPGA